MPEERRPGLALSCFSVPRASGPVRDLISLRVFSPLHTQRHVSRMAPRLVHSVMYCAHIRTTLAHGTHACVQVHTCSCHTHACTAQNRPWTSWRQSRHRVSASSSADLTAAHTSVLLPCVVRSTPCAEAPHSPAVGRDVPLLPAPGWLLMSALVDFQGGASMVACPPAGWWGLRDCLFPGRGGFRLSEPSGSAP